MLDFFRDGGPFMWPLGLWSILAVAFFIERVWTYARLRSEEELAEVTNDITGRVDYRLRFASEGTYATETVYVPV